MRTRQAAFSVRVQCLPNPTIQFRRCGSWGSSLTPALNRTQSLFFQVRLEELRDLVLILFAREAWTAVTPTLHHNQLTRHADLLECFHEDFTLPERYQRILVAVQNQHRRVVLVDVCERVRFRCLVLVLLNRPAN